MSARGFGSLVMAASVAGAALGCYLVSLKVASERSRLETVEAEIVSTQRDIRVLETEIGTRGRLAQLERWNANFIRLSAPSADQILQGSFQLATMVKPPAKPVVDAPMVLAAAPSPQRAPRIGTDGDIAPVRGAAPSDMMVQAGYKRPEPKAMTRAEAPPAKPAAKLAAATAKPDAPAKPVRNKPETKSARDPLAPLAADKADSTAKDTGTKQ